MITIKPGEPDYEPTVKHFFHIVRNPPLGTNGEATRQLTDHHVSVWYPTLKWCGPQDTTSTAGPVRNLLSIYWRKGDIAVLHVELSDDDVQKLNALTLSLMREEREAQVRAHAERRLREWEEQTLADKQLLDFVRNVVHADE